MHVIDESACEDGVRLLSLLLRHMPTERIGQCLLVVGQVPGLLAVPDGVEVLRVGCGSRLSVINRFAHKRIFTGQRPDVVLAYGSNAARPCSALVRHVRTPMIVTISDPADAGSSCVVGRPEGPDDSIVKIICASRTIQERLVGSGIPRESIPVILPGVDFAEIESAAGSIKRADIGLPEKGKVLLTMSPPTRAGGQFYALWAAAILHNIWPDACMVIPGISKEQQRLSRLIGDIYCPQIYFPTEDRYSPAQLLAVGDMLIAPALEDVPVYWLASAMAASVPIVASTVPAVTELIEDEKNGFLCPPGQPHSLAIRIRTAADSKDKLRRCTKSARTRAGKIFGAQRCVNEYLGIIDKLLDGSRLAAG